jgi:hypothetical protein
VAPERLGDLPLEARLAERPSAMRCRPQRVDKVRIERPAEQLAESRGKSTLTPNLR